MYRKQRLELTWIGKEHRPKLEPRILIEDPEKSYHAAHRVTEGDLFDNRLILGDNLLALKALETEFGERIKCIYIDPPFNTGAAFTQYDDGVEHSLWLGLMRDRLEILRKLLAPNGVMFAHIDDNEGHYLKVVMDEVFGRQNFVTTFIWRKVDSPHDNKVPVTVDHEYILCYAKNQELAQLTASADSSILAAYHNVDEQGRPYRDRLLKKNGKSSLRSDRPSMFFPIPGPDGEDVFPVHDDGREARWAAGKAAVARMILEDRLIWKNRGTDRSPRWVPYTREYAPVTPTRPYPTIWSDLPTTRQAKAHQKHVLPAGTEPFDTPKPEELLQRIISLATQPGDLVLDSFAGSGTTGAVAQKMGRRWVMIELGEHCQTHIAPRLARVVDGTDQGGITESTGWKGGGGFRYYRLAPSLLEQDKWGNWVITKEYNSAMLAEALCKLEGFRYEPSETVYWQQGRSTENDYLYATTQTLTHDQLRLLSEEVGSDRTLLVLCTAFRGGADSFPNLTVKKIPKHVLTRCEWGRDDYSLQVRNLPEAPPEAGQQELTL